MPVYQQSRVKKFLHAIQNLLGFHICVRRKPTEADESDEKLLNIFNELTVGISEVFDAKPQAFDEYLRCDKVSCKISVLSEQIGQVRILYSLWKNGYDLDPRDLITKLQSLNLLVDCIRDDVFYAYLRLPPEQKLQLLKKNKQVSAIFAVLGTLENEVSGMMKSMRPDEEVMKAIKPLLKPRFNRVVYRRKNLDSLGPPSYNTVQFSCRKVTYKRPSLVDAWTDPIEREYWDYSEGIGTKVDAMVPPMKDLEPVHQSRNFKDRSLTEDAAVQVSFDRDYGNDNGDFDVMITEKTVTLAEFKRLDRVSTDSLSADIDHSTTAFPRSSVLDPFSESVDCSNSIEPAHDISFWKMAASLIADKPVRT